MLRKVYYEELPKWDKEGCGLIGTTNWGKSVGHFINFEYDGIKGNFKIVSYETILQNLEVIYLDNPPYKINIHSIKEGMLGKLLGIYTAKFKVEIGTEFKDDKRDLVIIDREYRITADKNGWNTKWKYYKYKCNVCGWEGDDRSWMVESGLITSKQGCSCCDGRTVVEGINDVSTVAPWMIKYFQGGIEEAKQYTRGSDKKIIPICPECGKIREEGVKVGSIYQTHSINCICGDGMKYPEKFIFSVLNQLNIDFLTQLSKTTFDWCLRYRYDFYIPSINGILEAHGNQHYEKTGRKTSRTFEEELENDRLKQDLALNNGIKEEDYIIIDCRKSELEFIKDKIIHSRLNELFDLSIIDWNLVEEYTLGNLCKKACEIKRDNPEITSEEIGKILKLGSGSIIKYLKKGSKIWEWCNYDPKEEMRKSGIRTSQGNIGRDKQKVEIFKNNISLGVFESIGYLAKISENLFGVKLSRSGITRVCTGKYKQHKGYKFKRIEHNNINLTQLLISPTTEQIIS